MWIKNQSHSACHLVLEHCHATSKSCLASSHTEFARSGVAHKPRAEVAAEESVRMRPQKVPGQEVFKAAKAGVQITSRLLTCGPARNVCRSFGKQFQLGVAPKESKISLSLEERDRSLLLQGCQQTGLNS